MQRRGGSRRISPAFDPLVMAVTEFPGDAPLKITKGARGSSRHANTVNCRDYLRRSRTCGLDRLLRLSIAPIDRTALKTRLADFVPADFFQASTERIYFGRIASECLLSYNLPQNRL